MAKALWPVLQLDVVHRLNLKYSDLLAERRLRKKEEPTACEQNKSFREISEDFARFLNFL